MDASALTVISEERKANEIERSHSKGWRVVRASVQGTSHAKTGQPCQDGSSVGEDAPEGLFVTAITDGAGSAQLSVDGSRITACAATQRLVRLLKLPTRPLYEGVLKEILQEAVHFARKALEAEAVLQDKALRESATTLIVAVCAPRITGAAQIGDGAMVTARDGDGHTLFSAPQRGEYTNTTDFITSDNWQASLGITTRYGGVNRLAMFSDGIQSIALNTSAGNTPHAPFFARCFAGRKNRKMRMPPGEA